MKSRRIGVSPPVKIITTVALLLVEIALTVFLLVTMSTFTIWIYAAFQVINLVVIFSIINKRSNPSYKILWIVLIMLIPPIGGVIYLLWGSGHVTPSFRKRMGEVKASTAKYLAQNEETAREAAENDSQHARQLTFLYNQSGYPIWDNTETEYLSPGEVVMPRLLEELEKARKYIFLEFFIFSEGKMWDAIHEVLLRKVKQGVEVRIMYDDFGSILRQSHGFYEGLVEEGMLVNVFNPLRPSPDIFQNNRNHRKIMVVDGVVSFTGGMNIGDEYINLTHPHGYWMDCGIMLRGPATRNFTVMFCEMWNTIDKKDQMNPEKYLCDNFDTLAPGYVQPYCDSPVDNRNPGEGIYMQMFYTAKKYVYIISPYLILDHSMTQILKSTAQSGVDVRIITPKIRDKWYVHPVTQSSYGELLEAGVRIYEYTPGFIHSKIFVSDDRVATVGTVNMDYRSFYLHFECGVWMSDTTAVGDIKRHYLQILEESEEINLEAWKKRPLIQKVKQSVLRVFAPLM